MGPELFKPAPVQASNYHNEAYANPPSSAFQGMHPKLFKPTPVHLSHYGNQEDPNNRPVTSNSEYSIWQQRNYLGLYRVS